MKVLVTGASGFVGSNLLGRLVEDGYEVSALLRENSNHPLIQYLDFKRVSGDLLNIKSLLDATKNVDVVFHCAAKISFSKYGLDKAYSANFIGTKNLLDACLARDVKRFIFTSACATIGISQNPDIILDETSSWIPPQNWIYAHTKYLAERLVVSKSKYSMDTIILNPSAVYGQGDHNMNTGFAIKKIYNNSMLASPSGGTSYISINDLVEAHIQAMTNGVSGEKYILIKENLTYYDLFNRIASVLESKKIKYIVPDLFHYPLCLSMSVAETIMQKINLGELPISSHIMDELFMYKYYNNQKAINQLNWKPKDNLEDAVKQAMKYYKDQNML